MVTINDVAKKCKVSKSTVSKALNNKGNIKPETRKKILKAAKQLNYIPNIGAAALKNKKSFLIGIVFAEVNQTGLLHGFYSRIIEYFRREVAKSGYDIVFMSDKINNHPIDLCRKSLLRNLDGILLVTFDDEDQINKLCATNIPIVCVDRNPFEIPTIISDDISGSNKATNHLIELGHKDIVHIAGPTYSKTSLIRVEGFINSMKKANLESYRYVHADHYTFNAAYTKTLEVIKERVPDAIFAASDQMALGVIKALDENGIKVPDDVSLIGYDGLSFSQFSNPSLTTIQQNYEAIGTKAGDILLDMIKDPQSKTNSEFIEVELIKRESTIKKNK